MSNFWGAVQTFRRSFRLFRIVAEMVGADFEAVFEIQAVRIDAVVVDVDVKVDFGDACFRANFADFCQKAGGVANAPV